MHRQPPEADVCRSRGVQGGTERGGEAALTAFVMLAIKDFAPTATLSNGFACLEDGLLLANKTLYSEVGTGSVTNGSLVGRVGTDSVTSCSLVGKVVRI